MRSMKMPNKEYQNLHKAPRVLAVQLLDDFDGSVVQTLPAGSVVPTGRLHKEVLTKVLTPSEVFATLPSCPF